MSGILSRRPPTWLRLTSRHLAAHRLQSFLMVAGVALGVAVVISIDIANQSAERAFLLSTEAVSGRATHRVTGDPPSAGVPVAAYARLRRAGMRNAAPVVERLALPPSSGRALTLLGVDPFAEPPFRSYLDGLNAQSAALDDLLTIPGAALLAPQTAAELGIAVGDRFALEIDGRRRQLTLVATPATESPTQRRALAGLVLTDIATAQELTGRPRHFDRIDLILPSGAAAAADRAADLLGPGLQVVPVGASSGPVREMIDAFQVNLYALSLLALIVGMFLIFNTMTFAVVQRTALIGTLRALGVTRSEIFRGVCAEAALVALAGTGIGVGLGIWLGRGSVDMVTQTVNDLFYALTVRDVAVPPSAIAKGVALGLLATVATAALPAREAAAAAPRTALSRIAIETTASDLVRRSSLVALVLVAVGAVLLAAPSRSLWLAFSGLFALVIGIAFLAPLATVRVMQILGIGAPLVRRLLGSLAAAVPRDVTRSLSRTATAIAALMLAVSVAIGLRLMIGSFRTTVQIWMDATLQGDVYVSAPSAGGTASTTPLAPQVVAALRDHPLGRRLDLVRSTQVDSDRGPVGLSASSRPHFDDARLYHSLAVARSELPARLAAGGILVSEPLATRLGLRAAEIAAASDGMPGDDGTVLRFTIGGQTWSAPVLAVYYDYASSQGTVLMDREVYRARWGDPSITGAALFLGSDSDSQMVADELARTLAPLQTLRVRPNRELRADVLAVFDQAFAITDALVFLATAVAALGVLSSLLALQIERRRDYGMLRALGVTGRQAAGRVLLQTGLLGGVAALLALPTGILLALLLIHVINRRAFGWTMHLQLTAEPFAAAIAMALLAAVGAALIPAWRMLRSRAAELLQ